LWGIAAEAAHPSYQPETYEAAEATLRRHCDDHLEAQAVPREIRLIDRLPVSASGKADLGAVSPGG
jgi:acyl-coenzyme A synthetase/AMP-(fatty) acid ligase